MVEGPGCKVKGETMKPKVKGMVVVAVSGSGVNKKTSKKRVRGGDDSDNITTNQSEFDILLSQRLADVKTLGKELFIFFEAFHLCLRLHFLMSGGYRFNGQKLDNEMGGVADIPTLELHLISAGNQGTMKPSRLTFNKSAADVRPAQPSLDRIHDMTSLDICVDWFDPQRALSLVVMQKTRQVCDVLLDQQILPGVGNIIKNEGLFDSAIKPDTLVGELTEAHLAHLIKMTRDFSLLFYRCRRDGKPLHPHLKIYNKSTCKQCRGRCVVTKLGEDSPRLTYFCPTCQDNDFTRFTKRQSVHKGSLLGWVTQSVDTPPEDWACSQCTLINSGSRANCLLCHTPRVIMETTDKKTGTVNQTYHGISSVTNIQVQTGTKKTETVKNGYNRNSAELGMYVGMKTEKTEIIKQAHTTEKRIQDCIWNSNLSGLHAQADKLEARRQSFDKNQSSLVELQKENEGCDRIWPTSSVHVQTGKNGTETVNLVYDRNSTIPSTNDSNGLTSQSQTGKQVSDEFTQSESVYVKNGEKNFRFHRRKSTNKTSQMSHESIDCKSMLSESTVKKAFSDNVVKEHSRVSPNGSFCRDLGKKTFMDSQFKNSSIQNQNISVDRDASINETKTNSTCDVSQTISNNSTGSQQRTPLANILGKQGTGNLANGPTKKSGVKKGPAGPLWEPVACLGQAPKCEIHKVKCIRRQVHKKGENLHRMFWSCSRGPGCNMFKWADLEFPLCEGHKRRSVLRTVFKQGPNNTRRFFACPLGKNQQCGFFQWADQPKS